MNFLILLVAGIGYCCNNENININTINAELGRPFIATPNTTAIFNINNEVILELYFESFTNYGYEIAPLSTSANCIF